MANQPNLIQVQTGKEVAHGAKAQLIALVCPSPANSLTSELFISKAGKDSACGVNAMNKPTMTNAAPGKIEEFGKWFDGTYAFPEQEIIKIVGTRKVGGHGQRENRATMYLQSRSGAALRKVMLPLTGLDIMVKEKAIVQGRFDILSAEIMEAEYPELLNKWTARDLLPGSVARTFEIEEVMPEQTPRPVKTMRVVTNVLGEEVRIETRKRRRPMNI